MKASIFWMSVIAIFAVAVMRGVDDVQSGKYVWDSDRMEYVKR